MFRNALALRSIFQRSISTASRRQFKNRVKEHQKFFQEQGTYFMNSTWLLCPRNRNDSRMLLAVVLLSPIPLHSSGTFFVLVLYD
ncbi:PREDICTED: uncharacterized protein LOC107108975 isoform X1 [Gekko japonicus]|uniref:Uncharacterized protein LOC107108975 isoform X1 n=1 Tax=Gekko japonicus TaxID=146911 RepID=A0ABM1JU86_GEKJA|nr:PREDICTED: uncharacterized protein LOC107108975 isoform X1 [Gekko japonicus]